MPRIVISEECHRMIMAKAEWEFKETGEKRADGTWSIPVDWELVKRIRTHQLSGETLNDTIHRILSGKGN